MGILVRRAEPGDQRALTSLVGKAGGSAMVRFEESKDSYENNAYSEPLQRKNTGYCYRIRTYRRYGYPQYIV